MIKVCAYCRVSTDKSDQINSLDNQKQFFEKYISRQPDWELTEIYVDEGVTGTVAKKRASFMRMINDADNGKFQMIITKEISRFARNTLDSIYYTRYLRSKGVGVFFLNDNINTLDSDAELRLTILSSIAQEESRKTSERVKWGQKRRMEQGIVFGRKLLGFDIRNGMIIINREEADIVKRIFDLFTKQNLSSYLIAKRLNSESVLFPKKWNCNSVIRILKNEKYCGDLVQAKTYTPDFLTHKKAENTPENYIIIKNHHEAIIEYEQFNQAQRILHCQESSKTKKSNRYLFSSMIVCGNCNSTVNARRRTLKSGNASLKWYCRNCGFVNIDDEILKKAIMFAIKNHTSTKIYKTIEKKDIFEKILKQIITKITILRNNLIEIHFANEQIINMLIKYKDSDVSSDILPYQRCHFRTKVGTEELAHLEMIGAIVYQLTRNLSIDEIKKSGFDTYFVDHTTGVYPVAASGAPYTAASMQVKGDLIADLHEDLGAEQKARTTYDNILRFCDDPDVKDPIKFLRQREIVHYQRFGEGLDLALNRLNSKNFYAINPSFDK